MKTYLGDAVYAQFIDDYTIVLTTEDGIRETNRIVLEAEVMNNLDKFIKEYYIERTKKRRENK